MPEGKPFFEIPLIERLERRGITMDDAEDDFVAGWETGVSSEGVRYRYGRLGLYGYRMQTVMGREECVVFRMSFPGE